MGKRCQVLSSLTAAHCFFLSCKFFISKMLVKILTNNKKSRILFFSTKQDQVANTKQLSSNLLWCSCKPPQKSWCSGKVSGTRFLFLVPTRNPKTVNILKKWLWKSEVHLKKVLCKGYLWREAKTFPGEKRKHYQPTYNGKFSVGMHKHSKRWRSTLPKKDRDYKVSKIWQWS